MSTEVAQVEMPLIQEVKVKKPRKPRAKKVRVEIVSEPELPPVIQLQVAPRLPTEHDLVMTGEFRGFSENFINEEYHGAKAYYGSSQLKKVILDGIEGFVHSEETEQEDSDALTFGSAMHSLTFEPDLKAVMIDPEVLSAPRKPNRAKDLKTLESQKYKDSQAEHLVKMAAYEKLEAEKKATYRGKILLSPEDHELAVTLTNKLRADDVVSQLLSLKGKSEYSAFAKCPVTGLLVRCRFDRFFTDSKSAIDLKTTSAKTKQAFMWDASKFGYPYSVAHYLDTGSLVIGEEMQTMPLIVIQSKPPYQIWPIELDADDLAFARTQLEAAKIKIARCLDSGKWETPNTGFIKMKMPPSFRYANQHEIPLEGSAE